MHLATVDQTGVVKVGKGISVELDGEINALVADVSGGDGIITSNIDGDVEVNIDLGNNDAGLHIDTSNALDIHKGHHIHSLVL